MNQTPIISIVVPVYNVENYLEKCVLSLREQTFTDIEIILVDDGSPDGCPVLCDKFAKEDDRIRVIHKPNGGLSSARNAGLEIIRGSYYMFVDSDDWLDKNACKTALSAMEKHDADIVMFSYTKEFENHSIENYIFQQKEIVWEGDELKNNFHRRLFGLIGEEMRRPQDGDLIVSACMQLFKSKLFKGYRFVDTKKIGTEDCWYQIQVYYDCKRFVYIDYPYYHYLRTNESSLTTKYNPNLFERWQTLYDMMEKYIEDHQLDKSYKAALQNRICLSVLGAGLNEVHSKKDVKMEASEIYSFLNSDRYETALKQLDFRYLPLFWKIFFGLCKHKRVYLLTIMLKMIEYLRTHRH